MVRPIFLHSPDRSEFLQLIDLAHTLRISENRNHALSSRYNSFVLLKANLPPEVQGLSSS